MDMEQARFNMVEQQIRPWDVLDPRVLGLLSSVPRENFVPTAYRALAFADMEIPLGHGETMLSPKLEGRLLQALEIREGDRVLEIGTGSGYLTALLARAVGGGQVRSVDIQPEFTTRAGEALMSHGIVNVTLETGDAARGWPGAELYDAIVLTGSVPVLPESFAQSLKPGGRLLAVVGEAPMMQAVRVVRFEEGVFRSTPLFETSVPPLQNALQPSHFIF